MVADRNDHLFTPLANGIVHYERYKVLIFVGVDVEDGLLYYLKSSNITGVFRDAALLRGLLVRRNDIAFYLYHDRQLPPTLKNDNYTCKNCDHLETCTLYHKVRIFPAFSSLGDGERNKRE